MVPQTLIGDGYGGHTIEQSIGETTDQIGGVGICSHRREWNGSRMIERGWVVVVVACDKYGNGSESKGGLSVTSNKFEWWFLEKWEMSSFLWLEWTQLDGYGLVADTKGWDEEAIEMSWDEETIEMRIYEL